LFVGLKTRETNFIGVWPSLPSCAFVPFVVEGCEDGDANAGLTPEPDDYRKELPTRQLRSLGQQLRSCNCYSARHLAIIMVMSSCRSCGLNCRISCTTASSVCCGASSRCFHRTSIRRCSIRRAHTPCSCSLHAVPRRDRDQPWSWRRSFRLCTWRQWLAPECDGAVCYRASCVRAH